MPIGRGWWGAVFVLCATVRSESLNGVVHIGTGEIVTGSVHEDEARFYAVRILPAVPAVRVFLVSISGDADLFLSFRGPHPSATNATWVMDDVGIEELVLRRSSEDFCTFEPCQLYISLVGYETSSYRLYVQDVLSPETLATDSCAPGCKSFHLSDGVCAQRCNTSACAFDGGDCLLPTGAAELCAPGCAQAWLGDKMCDEACFNADCGWDKDDCRGRAGQGASAAAEAEDDRHAAAEDGDTTGPSEAAAPFACADGCLPDWIGDGECDAACNVPNCRFDGADCGHRSSECFAEPKGLDYRGRVASTEKGFACQAWSDQFPHQHAKTHLHFPAAGLGGHRFCRNPDGEMSPYCFTTDPVMRWDYCNVGAPTLSGCDDDRADTHDDADDEAADRRGEKPGDDAADDGDDGDDGDGDDDGAKPEPIRARPTDMAFVPGAGALDLAGDAPALTAAQVIVEGTSMAAPFALVLIGVLCCAALCALRRRQVERKDRGYAMTSAAADGTFADQSDEDDEDDEEEEGEEDYADDEGEEEEEEEEGGQDDDIEADARDDATSRRSRELRPN